MRHSITPKFRATGLVLAALFSVLFFNLARASAAALEFSWNARLGRFVPSAPVLSDFDGDRQPDQALLSWQGSIKIIHIQFGNRSSSWLSFDTGVSDPGRLVSEDINNDGYADLVWVSQSDPGKSAAWLGDGGGHFSLHSSVDLRLIKGLLLGTKFERARRPTLHELQDALPGPQPLLFPALAKSIRLTLSGSPRRTVCSPVLRPIFLTVPRKRGPPFWL